MNNTRHTLTEADTKLLSEFQQASAEFYAAQKALHASGLEDSKGVIERYKNAYQERLNKAVVFAASVEASVGMV